MKTMNIKHTAKSCALLKACSALKTAPLTSVVLVIPRFSHVFRNKNRTLPGFNPK
jgi:hypothetical protein